MVTKDTFRRGVFNGLNTVYELAKVIVPVYIIVTILKHTIIFDLVSKWFEPFMKILGLPGEAAVPIVLGNAMNFYAGVGAIASLGLSMKQITIISVMLSFSHNLPVETAVSSKVGVSATMILLIRIGLALTSGIILNLIL